MLNTMLHSTTTAYQPLRYHVLDAVKNYFTHLDGQPTNNLLEMVLREVEVPLLQTVLEQTKGNQSKAATILGISRATLRKKLHQYSLD